LNESFKTPETRPGRGTVILDFRNGAGAWDTDGQIYFARIKLGTTDFAKPASAPGSAGERKHPALALNARGDDQMRLMQLAATELELVVRLDPTNQYAAVEYGKAVNALREAQLAGQPASIDELKKRAKANITKSQPPQLSPTSEQPISLSFPHETPVKEIYKALGGSETDANRLERDLNILGQSAMIEGGIGSRYNIGKPQANLFRSTEGALGDEAAAAARGAIGPAVPPAAPRQSFAEASEQGMQIPRAGPQPPARPPDKAAAQSDRTNSEARESGPSSFEGKEQHALGSASASVATNSVPTAAAAEGGPKRIGSFTPRADLKYGGTDFGNHAHREIGSMLRKLYRDADLILRVEPGQRGIDVSVPEDHIARLGFAHAEIKPLSASGEKKLRQQIWKWGYDPSTVRAITYDANGNVYFGFR